MKKRSFLIIAVLLGVFFIAQRSILWNPIIRGDTSGMRETMIFRIDTDLTADEFILGDTTATGMYVPEQSMELIDVKIWGDPDDGDTMRVVVYTANGAAANETMCTTSNLMGTAWLMVDDATPSTTLQTATATEGIAVLYDFIAGTPNHVTIILEWKTRLQDAYE